MGPQCGGDGPGFPCRVFGILSSKLTTLSLHGKAAAAERRYCMHARPRAALIDYLIATWQTAGDRVIDGPRPEDGTDFSSYAAGASPDIPWYDCCGVVVAGHADHAAARADRSQRQVVMRVLCAFPRRADATGANHPYCAGTDRGRSCAARQGHRLRSHLLDRK